MPTSFASAQLALDLVGVFVFALSGGLVAVKKRFDLFGVLVLACAAALGGGIVRDLLIGDIPPVGISDWRLLTAATLGGLVTFLFQVLRRELYAVPAMLGSLVVVAAAQLGSLQDWVLWTAAGVVFALRMLAVRLHLNAPTPLRSSPA